MNKKLLIGITGGIGSGKSIVSSIIESYGYKVIKSDLIAKDIMKNNLAVKEKIINLFGEESYINNELNTKFLADKIFSSKENIEKINSIIHPLTIKKSLEIAESEFKKNNLVFIESALIYEAKIENHFNYIILIYSDEETRIKRVVERDNVTVHEVRRRMQYQIPDEEKKLWVDFVIENNSDEKDLKRRVSFLINLFNKL